MRFIRSWRMFLMGPGIALGVWALLTSLALAAVTPGPTVLSRANMLVTGSLPGGGSASYTVDYQPMTEGDGSKPAPWLLRMYYSAPGAPQGAVGFSWLDQTTQGQQSQTTAGNTGQSVTPQIGGNAPDVPVGTDTNTIQQAILSGAGPGTFAITLLNSSSVAASYTLHLYPLVNGALEAGLNPNPTPVSIQPGAGGTPVPASPPAPASPQAPPAPPPFTPFWVKTLVSGAQLYSAPTSPPGEPFGPLSQFACLQVVEEQSGSRFHVLNPATRNYAYINARDVGGLAPNDRSCG